MYLAAAGVGTLGIVDDDVVDLSNLQRQVVHGTADVGLPKAESAARRLADINPSVHVVPHPVRLTSENALSLFAGYDLVVDGTDNFATRYLVNDACVLSRRPYVYGSVFRFEGQASVFAAPGGPCYRCLFPEPPPPGLVPSCAQGGVLGVLPGIIGSIQASEAIKLLLGIGDPLIGRLLVFEALEMRFREVRLRPDPDCPACGTHPTVHELQDYEEFCGGRADRAGASGRDIGPSELKQRLDAGQSLVLLDVREPMEHRIVSLPGSVLVPLGELPARVGELDASAEYVGPNTSSTATTASGAPARSSSFAASGCAPGTWPAESPPGPTWWTRRCRDTEYPRAEGGGRRRKAGAAVPARPLI
ncbi:MAG: moeZ [Acidobacteria bacterium]|nr:moeZ [Acidobacteriota bacterium]